MKRGGKFENTGEKKVTVKIDKVLYFFSQLLTATHLITLMEDVDRRGKKPGRRTKYNRAVKSGKKITRKTIVRDFQQKTRQVETKLYSSIANTANVSTGSTVLLSIHHPPLNPSLNPSLEVNQPSIIDEIPNDPYYTQKNAPLFIRPPWRKRRPMVAQNKWRRRPIKKNITTFVDPLQFQKQTVFW